MLNLSAFRTRFPEFAKVADATIQAALDAAAARTDVGIFGAHTDAAHGYMAAHLLAASPSGRRARLRGEAFQSLYLAERERLERVCAPRWV